MQLLSNEIQIYLKISNRREGLPITPDICYLCQLLIYLKILIYYWDIKVLEGEDINGSAFFPSHQLSFKSIWFVISSKILFLTGTCLTLYSSLSASFFVIAKLAPTNSTGLRDLVYFAPWPELCANKRFFRLLVIPQYRDSSEHRTR